MLNKFRGQLQSWQPLSIKVRRRSGHSWIFPEFLQRLKVPSLMQALFSDGNEDVMTNTAQSQKDPHTGYEYISSGKTVASIQNRAKVLLNQIVASTTDDSQLSKIGQLIAHMKKYPVTRALLIREGSIPVLLCLKENTPNEQIRMASRAALTILGYTEPVKENGIRILSLDGGGSRGVITIEILKRLEELTGQRVNKMFDLIVGTSTGALLAFLIGINRMALSEISKMYQQLSSTVFKKQSVLGPGKLFFTHAFYDTDTLVSILKSEVGTDKCMIDTAFDARIPKVAAVSTLVNRQILQPYVFRNYCIPPMVEHNYHGSSQHKLWEALQASSAAPGFFEECRIGPDIHQDGGLLTNNPCSLAIHESKRLWPNTPLQTVISIGNGVYHGRSGPNSASFTTLREKLLKVVASATDVEAVHITLKDLLPPTTYFRFNPNMSVDAQIDEVRPDVMKQLIKDTRNYIDKYDWKYRKAADSLMKKKTGIQKAKEKFMLQLMMRK